MSRGFCKWQLTKASRNCLSPECLVSNRLCAEMTLIFSKILSIGIAAGAILLLTPERAESHAIAVEANPKANSVITGPDVELKLRFNTRIDQTRSRLVVVSETGSETVVRIRTGATPDTVSGQAVGLTPGNYLLRWTVLANDGHITRGEVPFKVRVP